MGELLTPTKHPWSDDVSDQSLIKTMAYRQAHRHDRINSSPLLHARASRTFSGSSRTSHTPLGSLELFPLELLNAIFEHLDLVSLFHLRQVNTRSRQIVHSMPQYNIIVTKSYNCFCVILRTEWGSRVTLLEYFACLCEELCSRCEASFGTFVHIPTMKRYCGSCKQPGGHQRPGYFFGGWTERVDSEIQMITVGAAKILKLSEATLCLIPKLKLPRKRALKTTTPGTHADIMHIIPLKLAMHLYTVQYAGKSPSQEVVDTLLDYNHTLEYAFCALPTYNPHSARCWTALSCAGCELIGSDDREATYTMQGFLDHIKACGGAWQLWARSNGGSQIPGNFPDACRKGGYLHAEHLGQKPLQ